MSARVILGNNLDVLPTLPSSSFDCVITDPPYPEIGRSYGKWTEAQWFELMKPCFLECKRLVKPTGSAMFVLQPNSRKVGSMRLWLWEFLLWAAKEWNLIQDCYWWNFTVAPMVHSQRKYGLLRPSVKYCLWFGAADCYRNQSEVLWTASDATLAKTASDRALKYMPCGMSLRTGRIIATAKERGGSTPFNLIPLANANSSTSAGAHGHGAGTPERLADWWTRYLCPAGGSVLDPFAGVGSCGLPAVASGRSYLGIEIDPSYCATANERLAKKNLATG